MHQKICFSPLSELTCFIFVVHTLSKRGMRDKQKQTTIYQKISLISP
jgi:hypothetical protein